ncbi:uncharacterized protein LOC141552964 [Sminthopsis crassicaudata]|uniref:uncharacterized protein LOC141552964 n=1 Tax=Sminthopsis crassicaudata TaxID=9301 RepID=UPI003D694E5F
MRKLKFADENTGGKLPWPHTPLPWSAHSGVPGRRGRDARGGVGAGEGGRLFPAGGAKGGSPPGPTAQSPLRCPPPATSSAHPGGSLMSARSCSCGPAGVTAPPGSPNPVPAPGEDASRGGAVQVTSLRQGKKGRSAQNPGPPPYNYLPAHPRRPPAPTPTPGRARRPRANSTLPPGRPLPRPPQQPCRLRADPGDVRSARQTLGPHEKRSGYLDLAVLQTPAANTLEDRIIRARALISRSNHLDLLYPSTYPHSKCILSL